MEHPQRQPATQEAQPMARESFPKPESITKETLLLVEGNDSRNFFEAMRDHLSLSHQLQIINFGGIKQLKNTLLGLRGASGFTDIKSIGIIRDAETNPTGAFQSVQASLRRAKLPIPANPEQLSCDGQPAVGVLILPGQGKPGMLETLLCKTFADAPECRCIDVFFKCVEELRQGRTAKRPDKARAQAFIATQPDPHVSVGVAARKRYWNLDHQALAPVRDFLKSVAAAAN
ncbi:MAG: hypothetical protein F4Z10_05490 [Synechococcus sp. SB0666_bin_14]|nr:hypothetical protein [Synechococcus sp. SB0666_bin_14]